MANIEQGPPKLINTVVHIFSICKVDRPGLRAVQQLRNAFWTISEPLAPLRNAFQLYFDYSP